MKNHWPAKAVGAGGRQIGAGAFVHHQRHAQFLQSFVQRIVVGIVERAAFNRIGPHKDRLEAELVDTRRVSSTAALTS